MFGFGKFVSPLKELVAGVGELCHFREGLLWFLRDNNEDRQIWWTMSDTIIDI